MSFNPITEVVNELKDKMKALLPQLDTQIAVIDELANIKYIDSELEAERADYIKDYVETNFSLIQVDQYSLPLSGVLLGFFKISKKVMLVLYSGTGKVGNLLAYRGVISTFTAKIDEALFKLQEIYELESIAYDVIRLKKVKAIEATPAADLTVSESATPFSAQAMEPNIMYPKLDPKFAKKRFPFDEGLVLQYASDAKYSVTDISEKCKKPVQEVLEIIDKYEKKGWLEIIYKK